MFGDHHPLEGVVGEAAVIAAVAVMIEQTVRVVAEDPETAPG